MRHAKMTMLAGIGLLLAAALVFAAGDAARGKELFNDPTLGGSTNEKSCNTCHPNGEGLEGAGTKKFTRFMGLATRTLEDVVSLCIENPLEGKPLATDSQDMQDLVAYIKSLGG